MSISITDPTKLPEAIFDLFFRNEEVFYGGQKVVKYTVNMKMGGTISKAIVGDFLYLEQNPYKNSENGRLAKQGNKIMWIIYEPKNKNKKHPFRPGQYVAKVMNGVMERLV